MGRTYGTLHWSDGRGGRPVWGIECEPHVAIRFKRMFARVRNERSGLMVVTDTPDVALDVEWFIGRYPLQMTDEVRARLIAQADVKRDQEEQLLQVLSGARPTLDFDLLDAARPLRDYQEDVSRIVWSIRRMLLTDDTGLGKTTSALGVLRNPDCLPAVFVTLSDPLPAQMMREMGVVLPGLRGHVINKGRPYDVTKARGMHGQDADVLFMSYSKLRGWADHLAGEVRTVIFDEAQELRRSASEKYVGAGQIADRAEYVLGMTATPVYNYGGEMFNVANVIRPDVLGSREEFVREWGGETTTSGQTLVKEPGALGHYLTEVGFMLGRTRADVRRELPTPPQLIPHLVQADGATLDRLSAGVLDLAALLLDPMASTKDKFLAGGQIDLRLRHATGLAKAPYVAEFIKLLLESEDKIVVYAWHRDVYDVLMTKLAAYRTVMFTGSESPKQKQAAKDSFMTPTDQGGARVLLMSLRAGAGLDGLQFVSSCVVFAELDWSQGIHHQCVSRVDRDGQESPVVAYFLHSEDGSDPALLEVLNIKAMQADQLVHPGREETVTPAPDTDRARKLAAAALRRAGMELPEDVVAGEAAPDAAAVAELFAEVAEVVDREPAAGQLGLFE